MLLAKCNERNTSETVGKKCQRPRPQLSFAERRVLRGQDSAQSSQYDNVKPATLKRSHARKILWKPGTKVFIHFPKLAAKYTVAVSS